MCRLATRFALLEITAVGAVNEQRKQVEIMSQGQRKWNFETMCFQKRKRLLSVISDIEIRLMYLNIAFSF